MNGIFSILIPLVSLGVGCMFLYVSWKGYFSTRNINDWETTQRTITKSDIKSAGAAFIPDIEYQYSVLGIEYKGIGVTIPPDLIYDHEIVKGLLAEYPVGKTVEVYYNPEIHRLAVLEKLPSGINNILILIMLMITASAFLIVAVLYSLRLFQ